MNVHWLRWKQDATDFLHSTVNLFVEPFKKWLPQSVPGFRPDNQEGLFKYTKKPLGYFVGHLVAWIAIMFALILLGLVGQFILALISCVLGGICKF